MMTCQILVLGQNTRGVTKNIMPSCLPCGLFPTTLVLYFVQSFSSVASRVIESLLQLLYLTRVDCLLQWQLVVYLLARIVQVCLSLALVNCSSCLLVCSLGSSLVQSLVLLRLGSQCLLGLTFVTNACDQLCCALQDLSY